MSSKEENEKQIVKISYQEFYQKYLKDTTTANVLSEYMTLIQLHRGNTFSKSSMLSDESYQTSVVNEPNFWRSSCQCPLSNRSFESEVLMDTCSNKLSTIYGQYGVDFRFYNGKIYFRVKKMAQRAAMIHAYYSAIVSDVEDVHLLHEEEVESYQLKLTQKVPSRKIEEKPDKVADAAPQDQGDETTSEGAEQKTLLQITYEEFYKKYVVEESTSNSIGNYMKLIQDHKGNAFSKKKMLKDQSHETSAADEPTYWRSTCQCPISNMPHESEVLIQSNPVSTTYGQYGVDFRFFQGKVYFRVKKMAQRAAMIHAYYNVIVTDKNHEHLFKEVIDAVNSNPQEASSDDVEMSKEEVKEEDGENKPIQNDAFCTVAIPDDIRLLYNQGVRNDSIQSIEFHVVEPKSKDEYIKIASAPISKEMPTLMVCNIELKSPKLKVTSRRPHKSKSKAFKDTVSVLIPQLLDCKQLRCQDNEEMELVALHQRYHDAEIFYKAFPPPCTVQNIFEANSDKHRFHLYTYEVPMIESLGSTCCGILFPYCEGLHTCKPLILHSTGVEAIAKIHQVSMVELSNDEIDTLIGFNCLLHDGTSYGRSKKYRKSELSRVLFQRLSKFTEQSKERMRTSMLDRTHLSIPLDRNNDIDFDLISTVLLNDLKSCRQWRSFAMRGEMRYAFDKKKPGEVFILSEDSLTSNNDDNSMVPAKRSTSVKNDFNSMLSATSKNTFIQLNEGDVQIFPLPFKLMMAFHSLNFFYPQLERIFELRELELFLKIPSRAIEEATTTAPVAYERLEHLGDSVLFYYVALKLFAGNTNMTDDEEDMADMKAKVVKNTVLAKVGFRCGINRLLRRNTCTNYVLSYLGNENSPGGVESKQRVNPTRVADVVESLLGVVFSESFSKSDENLTWLLNELELPLDSLDNDEDLDFYNPSYCEWHGQLESMKAMLVLSSHAHITQRLCHCLENLQILFRLPELKIEERLMLYCALYDDGLEWDMDDDLVENKLILLSRFRENLFFIGEASLHLLITYECFQRFPTCSAGDLHLLKACAMADDVIAYITIKNRIHKMLFDQDEPEERIELLQMIEQAEYKGLADWRTEMKRGWVIGLEEFQRRSKSTSQSPRYCGIGGGCLIGQKAKLGKKFTEDLVFSFKAIMGACVIAFGFKQMRNLFIPLFDELLFLTPDEIRTNYSTPLTRTNSSGKRDRSHRNMEALRQKFGDGWSVFNVNDI